MRGFCVLSRKIWPDLSFSVLISIERGGDPNRQFIVIFRAHAEVVRALEVVSRNRNMAELFFYLAS